MEWMALLEMIKLIGAAAGGILSIVALFTAVSKKPKKWLIDTTKEATAEAFEEIKNTHKEEFDEIKAEINKIHDFNNKTKETDLCVLRHEITFIYEKYSDKKEIPSKMKENLCLLYENYTRRGGNTYVESIFKEMMNWKVI